MYVAPDRVDAPLYVLTCLFNPIRFKARWKHYARFARYVKDSGAILITIEASFGERHAAIDALHGVDVTHEPADPALTRCDGATHRYIRVRTRDELWIKENLLALAMQHLPADARYIAWVDADVIFVRPNWVGETIHQLQHYDFVQMFSRAQDVGPNQEPIGTARQSFTDGWQQGLTTHPEYGYRTGLATGLAWAARREALDAVGGLMQFCCLGSADWHMAHALVNQVDQSRPGGLSQDYKDRLLEWQFRAERYVRRNVGTVSGLVLHYWHGKKADRGYTERWQPLVDFQYAPSTDIKQNTHGVLQLCDHGDERSIALRDAFKRYFRSRSEDSIDVA